MHRMLALLGLPIAILALGACTSSAGASGAAPSSSATLASTVWTVTSVGGSFVDATNPPTMDFGADGTLSGTTGCNQYNGSYTVDGNGSRSANS